MKHWSFPLSGILIGTVAAWLVFPGAITVLRRSMPVGYWFEVNTIHAESVAEGEVPDIRVDWRIHRPFAANWIVSVQRLEADGLSVQCSRTGRGDFRSDTASLQEADLDWWMEIPPKPRCTALTAGSYIVTITWEIEIDGLPSRFVRAESNIFKVTE